jgi:hypothetical protein
MKLFERYPRPWRIEQDETIDPNIYQGGFTVFDASGQIVIFGGTYTGDGDAEFNLNRTQVAELVALVNAV